MTIGGLTIRNDLNISNVVGFFIVFATVIASWTSLQGKQTSLDDWKVGHEKYHVAKSEEYRAQFSKIDTVMTGIEARLNSDKFDISQLTFRTAQIEKAYEAVDIRVSRIVESYSNQFTDMRTQLNTISTQLALTNQTLNRIEAIGKGAGNVPPEYNSQFSRPKS